MKFFGRKSAGRGVSRPALLRGWSSWGSGGEVPRSYEDRVREGYVNNPVAQRAVRLVAEGVGSAPVMASNPVVLPLLHAKTAGQGLVETVAMQLLLHGNAYVQVLTGADGAPVELFALRPERVTIEADARGWPVAFLYKAGEATMRIAAEDAAGRPAVIHIKTANPLDDHYGLGCLGATVTLPWRAMTVGPGDRVVVPGLSGTWRVMRVIFEAMVVRLDLVLIVPASLVPVIAEAGRNRPQVDLPHGPTTLHIIDLPPLGDGPEAAPFVAVAANGASGGWRRAALMTSIDAGTIYSDAGMTALPAVMGRTATVLAMGSADLIDRVNVVEVQMVHPALILSDADNDALLAGGNLAMIGNEAVQFGRASLLGSGRWRLSELWRGRRGTEWAVATHPIDTPFLLVESPSLARLSISAAVASVRVMAVGVGDVTGAVADGPAETGASVRPLSPVSMTATPSGSDLLIGWTRRSRDDWRWRDLVEVPVGEESERYRVTKVVTGRPDLIVEITDPTWTYAAAERATDVAAGAALAAISVVQIGAFSVSKAASITVPTT